MKSTHTFLHQKCCTNYLRVYKTSFKILTKKEFMKFKNKICNTDINFSKEKQMMLTDL